jgi:hypothetical protein
MHVERWTGSHLPDKLRRRVRPSSRFLLPTGVTLPQRPAGVHSNKGFYQPCLLAQQSRWHPAWQAGTQHAASNSSPSLESSVLTKSPTADTVNMT